MKQVKTLVLTFVCEDGQKSSISLEDPRTDLTPSDIKEAMTQIIALNVLNGSKGLYDYTTPHSAQYVVRTVNEVDID